ncbi:MAG TPA: hypothetical protein VHX15_21985 [Frankiaceae bacterium]|nr:hypothetical protein [Frankiaceae bacterium]
MTDDPWRQADASASVPRAAFGADGGYFASPAQPPAAVPQYAPELPAYKAYSPANAYQNYAPNQAPLPKRGGYRRLFWILGTVGVLVLGGCGVGIFFAVNSVGKDIHAANAFLSDVRHSQFTAAYQRLCSSEQARGTADQFAADLQAAAARGHGVTGYNINSGNTTENFGSGGSSTSHSAGGTVNFASGESERVTLVLQDAHGQLCVLSGYEGLF